MDEKAAQNLRTFPSRVCPGSLCKDRLLMVGLLRDSWPTRQDRKQRAAGIRRFSLRYPVQIWGKIARLSNTARRGKWHYCACYYKRIGVAAIEVQDLQVSKGLVVDLRGQSAKIST
jgi:hypothetical protein